MSRTYQCGLPCPALVWVSVRGSCVQGTPVHVAKSPVPSPLYMAAAVGVCLCARAGRMQGLGPIKDAVLLGVWGTGRSKSRPG